MWFPTSTSQLQAGHILSAILQTEPDTTQINRTPSPQAPFLSQATLAQDGAIYTVQVQPGRANLIIQPVDEAQSLGPDFPLMDFEPIFSRTLDRIMNQEVSPVGDCLRLSIVVNVSWQRESRRDANVLFRRLTSIEADPEAIDLIYQMNLRHNIDEGFTINTIRQFSVNEVQQVQVPLGVPMLAQMNVVSGPTIYLAGFNLDYNTVPTGQVINNDLQSKVLSSLRDNLLRTIDSISEVENVH